MVSLARAVAPQIPLLHDLPWVMFGVGFIYVRLQTRQPD